MQKILTTLIRTIKKDPLYNIDAKYDDSELIHSLLSNFPLIVRGLIFSLGRKEIKNGIFIGNNVTVKFKKKLQVKSGTMIEDGCKLECLSKKGIQIGRGVTIANYSILKSSGALSSKGKGIVIGDNSAIGSHSFIAGQGGVDIGADVIAGPGLKIFSANHNFESVNTLIRLQNESKKGVIIKNNCWIGAGVTILDGVTIGEGSIIGANSLVNSDIPDYSIAVGSPSKVIKNRKTN